MSAPSELLERWAPSAVGQRALVLGAGGGAEAAWLAAEGFQVVAVEKDPERAAALTQACAGMAVTVRQADVEAMEFAPGGHDLITALAVLHFVSPGALPSLARYIVDGLAVGGLLLAQVLTADDPSAQARRTQADPEPLPNTFVMEDGQGLIHYFDRGELPALFPTLRHLEHEIYRFAVPGRPDGFGAGEILVAEKAAAARG